MSRAHSIAGITVWLTLSAIPGGVFAQQATAPGGSQGPMSIERVSNGVVIAPEFKVTRANGSTARFAGAYGGWLMDNTLLIGAGAYWLTNGSREFDMRYGGGIVEWLHSTDRPVGFSVRGLVGWGRATLTDTFRVYDSVRYMGYPVWNVHGFTPYFQPVPTSPGHDVRLTYHEDFLVAEPQANVLLRVNQRVRVSVGAGYRAVAAAKRIDHRLRGPSGSVAVEISLFSR